MAYELETTVFGGLPITVEYSVAGAEPDVGIMSGYVDDWEIIAVGNRLCKKPPQWLYRKLDANPKEREKLVDELNESAFDW